MQVDFDKSKHLSDKSIKRRRIEREKLQALEQEKEDRVRKEREAEERKRQEERYISFIVYIRIDNHGSWWC